MKMSTKLLKGIVTFCVKNASTIFIIGVCVFLYGIYSVKTAKLDIFPEFAPAQIVIQTESPGFSAELTDQIIVSPISEHKIANNR